MGNKVIVDEIYKCEICNTESAEYDCKSKDGWWAYMCGDCFRKYGIGLGLGRGQKISIKEEKNDEVDKR